MVLSMQCNGTCTKFAVKKPAPKYGGLYESGHKRCSCCEIYIIYDGGRCPCCGCALRAKPRNGKARSKLVEFVNGKKGIV